MQYGNLSPSAYSQLKIHIVTVEAENKEKIEELNQKIGNTSSIFNTQLNNQIATIEKTIEEVKNTVPNNLNIDWEMIKTNANKVPGVELRIPTIPSDLNANWETVKTNANKVIEVLTIPSDLNEEWEIVKENASREIPTIPSDLNEEWETVKENANREIPTIPSDLNTEWETVKENANKVPGIEYDIDNKNTCFTKLQVFL
jgi:hypothetical protein